MKYTKEALTAARLAWNELSEAMDSKPSLYASDEEFDMFYSVLVEKLFEETTEE